jgi:hypothetical protein
MKRFTIFAIISALCGLVCVSAKSDQTREALSNGGFESGGASWSCGYYSGGATTSAGPFQGVNAHSGQWYGYLGDETLASSNANGFMYQYLQPRPEANALAIDVSLYVNVTSQDTSAVTHDTMTVILRFFDDNLNFLYDVPILSFSNKDRESDGNPKTYHLQQASYNLTQGGAGHWVTLLFKVQTDSSEATTFRIDDVSAKVITPDQQYVITPSAGVGGTIYPNTAQTEAANGSVSFTASPYAAYTVDQWYLNGNPVQSGGNSLTLYNINAAENVSVTFKALLYKINVQIFGSGNYAINPPGGSYATGTPITITATPNPGNLFSEWRGSQYSRNTVLSFAKGGADESLEVHFEPIIVSANMSLSTSVTTPATWGINLPTPTTCLTLCEESYDLGAPVWYLVGVVYGQNPITAFNLPPPPNGKAYVRTSYVPQVNTPPFLNFPVHNWTPSTAPVTAIMDHSRPDYVVNTGKYNKDHAIRTAQGATYPILAINQGSGNDFAVLSPNTVVSTLFNYVGVSAEGGAMNLQYDGHPGYDYGFGCGTDIYAAAAGTVMTDQDFVGTSLDGTGIATYYMTQLHALIINHNNGYCSIYMHLSSIDSTYVDTSGPSWVPIKASVSAGSHIGESGDFDNISRVPCHFHFEVWRLDGGITWNYADPYGYSATNPDNSTTIITPVLWTGN